MAGHGCGGGLKPGVPPQLCAIQDDGPLEAGHLNNGNGYRRAVALAHASGSPSV